MQQQLNTPEDLRAIRQAMDEGKNPLVETDVPRWEDQVGISRIVNRRVLEFEVLPTPAQVLGDLPLSEQAQEIVAYSRDEIRACLYGQDDRLLVVVGPCSVHDPKAALDYARRLSALNEAPLDPGTRLDQRSGYRRQLQYQEGLAVGPPHAAWRA